ncbi:hypothetical protein [Planctobacterium marinum]|uniref:Uncharacterized protein n=1 Tax=Planctobacterium marinum TaxID=1631968 RepID=A0AA48HKK1_9ALTE|nr:hypothetical protein MACH26_07630 [Planctobacterium marinum]
MTPQMLLEELQQKIGKIAVNLNNMPKGEEQVANISHSLEDVIIDLECVRDYIKVRG